MGRLRVADNLRGRHAETAFGRGEPRRDAHALDLWGEATGEHSPRRGGSDTVGIRYYRRDSAMVRV